MKHSVIQQEIDRYDEVLTSVAHYADYSPGQHFVDAFIDMSGAEVSRTYVQNHMEQTEPTTIIDAGCATGQGGLELAKRGFAVELLDITDAGLVDEARELPFHQGCLWTPLTKRWSVQYPEGPLSRGTKPLEAQYVFCTDVMEHLPCQFTMLAVIRMLEAARTGVFLSISLVPDAFGVWVGHPLHQTVQPFDWWKQSLSEIATLVECRDLLNTGLYYVEKR